MGSQRVRHALVTEQQNKVKFRDNMGHRRETILCLGTYYKCRFSGLTLVSLHFHKVSGWFYAQFGLRSPVLEKAVWAALPPSPSPSGRALFWGTLRPVEWTLFYWSVYWLVLLRFVKVPEILWKQSLGEIDFISPSWSLMEQNGLFLLFIWSFCWVWERHAAGCG